MKQNQNTNQEENRLFLARKNNLEKIIQMGIDPYPKAFERSHFCLLYTSPSPRD